MGIFFLLEVPYQLSVNLGIGVPYLEKVVGLLQTKMLERSVPQVKVKSLTEIVITVNCSLFTVHCLLILPNRYPVCFRPPRINWHVGFW
jgi:hypothetical protein